jgi:hypothetical protein
MTLSGSAADEAVTEQAADLAQGAMDLALATPQLHAELSATFLA